MLLNRIEFDLSLIKYGAAHHNICRKPPTGNFIGAEHRYICS